MKYLDLNESLDSWLVRQIKAQQAQAPVTKPTATLALGEGDVTWRDPVTEEAVSVRALPQKIEDDLEAGLSTRDKRSTVSTALPGAPVGYPEGAYWVRITSATDQTVLGVWKLVAGAWVAQPYSGGFVAPTIEAGLINVAVLGARLLLTEALRTIPPDPSVKTFVQIDNGGFWHFDLEHLDELGNPEAIAHLGPDGDDLLTLGRDSARKITLDNNGNGSFYQVSAEEVKVKGRDLDQIIDQSDNVVFARHQFVKGEISASRRGQAQILGIDAYLPGRHVYRIEVSGMTVQSDSSAGNPGLGLHVTLDGSYPGDNWGASQVKETNLGPYSGYRTHEGMWYDVDLRDISSSVNTFCRAGVTLREWSNVTDCRVHTSNNVPQITITRLGRAYPNRGTRNLSGGAPLPVFKTRRVVTYKATGWANYRENSTIYTNSANAPSQGDPQTGILQSSCFFFDSWRELMAGKTIHRISLFSWADYWYYNDGGLAKWHTHTQFGSIPNTQPTMTYLGVSPRPYNDANYYGDFWRRGSRGRWDLNPSQFGWWRDTVRGFGFHAQGDRNPRYYGRFSNIVGANTPTLVEIDMEGDGTW